MMSSFEDLQHQYFAEREAERTRKAELARRQASEAKELQARYQKISTVAGHVATTLLQRNVSLAVEIYRQSIVRPAKLWRSEVVDTEVLAQGWVVNDEIGSVTTGSGLTEAQTTTHNIVLLSDKGEFVKSYCEGPGVSPRILVDSGNNDSRVYTPLDSVDVLNKNRLDIPRLEGLIVAFASERDISLQGF